MFEFSDLDGWLKFIHVLASIVWVGGAALLVLYGTRMPGADAARRLHFAEIAGFAGRVFSVAAVFILAVGIWLVARVDIWEFESAWISIGFLGVAVGFALGIGFFGPQTRALISAIEGESAAEAGTIARRIALVSQAEFVLLLVVVWAMVFKPGL